MPNFRVVYSDEAAEQLREIYNYIMLAFLSPETARQQTDRIMSSVELLGLFPKFTEFGEKTKKATKSGFALSTITPFFTLLTKLKTL